MPFFTLIMGVEKHCGVTKKTMTTLEESELDVIFDVITKKNKVENFDEYVAPRRRRGCGAGFWAELPQNKKTQGGRQC